MNPKSATDTIRVYIFWYEGLEQPVKIEARSRYLAKMKLQDLLPKLPEAYRYTPIINETIESLVSGSSHRMINGVNHVWNANKGWVISKKK